MGSKVMYTIGYDITDYMILAIIIMNAFALSTYIKVVKSSPEKQSVNFVPVVLQILGLLIWTATWTSQGVIFLMNH